MNTFKHEMFFAKSDWLQKMHVFQLLPDLSFYNLSVVNVMCFIYFAHINVHNIFIISKLP